MKKANRELLLVYDTRNVPESWSDEIATLEIILQEVETAYSNALVSEVFDIRKQKAILNTYRIADMIRNGSVNEPFYFLSNKN